MTQKKIITEPTAAEIAAELSKPIGAGDVRCARAKSPAAEWNYDAIWATFRDGALYDMYRVREADIDKMITQEPFRSFKFNYLWIRKMTHDAVAKWKEPLAHEYPLDINDWQESMRMLDYLDSDKQRAAVWLLACGITQAEAGRYRKTDRNNIKNNICDVLEKLEHDIKYGHYAPKIAPPIMTEVSDNDD